MDDPVNQNSGMPDGTELRREAVTYEIPDPNYRILETVGFRYYLDDREITEAEFDRLRAEWGL